MQNYIGSTEILSGLIGKNGRDIPLVNVDQIQAKPDGSRLGELLDELTKTATSGPTLLIGEVNTVDAGTPASATFVKDGSKTYKLNLNIPKGDTGLQGETGVEGPKGEKGDTGLTGLQGEQGPIGPQGLQGATGVAGPEGPQGPAGAVGPAGPQGEKGEKGEQGDLGPAPEIKIGTVETLPAGSQAEATITGANGVYTLNLKIPQGEIGSAGSDGEITTVQGPKGEKGDPGEQGPAGPQGETGPQGPIGPQGVPGQPGARGEQGLTGPEGPQGATGVAGPQGVPGQQGPKGDKGDKGDPGEQGPAGKDGISEEKVKELIAEALKNFSPIPDTPDPNKRRLYFGLFKDDELSDNMANLELANISEKIKTLEEIDQDKFNEGAELKENGRDPTVDGNVGFCFILTNSSNIQDLLVYKHNPLDWVFTENTYDNSSPNNQFTYTQDNNTVFLFYYDTPNSKLYLKVKAVME